MREDDKLSILDRLDENILEQTLARRAKLIEKPLGRRKGIKRIALAASLVLVLGAVLLLGRMLRGIANDPFRQTGAFFPSSKEEPRYLIGSQISSAYGSLTFLDETESSVTLLLEKTTGDTLHFYMEAKKGDAFLVTNDRKLWVWKKTVLTDLLAITVNGEVSEDGQLPTDPGSYRIVVDFSRLFDIKGAEPVRFRLSGFDVMYLNGENLQHDMLSFSYDGYYDIRSGKALDVFRVFVSRMAEDPTHYLKTLYLSCENAVLSSVTAFGRELPTEEIDGTVYYVLDTSLSDSEYNLEIYLFLYFEGKTNQTDRERIRLRCYENGTEEENAFTLCYFSNRTPREEASFPHLYGTFDALPEEIPYVIPTVFPKPATLINQLYWDPEGHFLHYSYKTEDVTEECGIRISDTDIVFGDQKVTYYTDDVEREYKIVQDDAGYDTPPVTITWWEGEYACAFYINIRAEIDAEAIIRGLDHTGALKNQSATESLH